MESLRCKQVYLLVAAYTIILPPVKQKKKDMKSIRLTMTACVRLKTIFLYTKSSANGLKHLIISIELGESPPKKKRRLELGLFVAAHLR